MGVERFETPQRLVAGIHGVNMCVERDHALSVSDTADHAAEPVDFYFIESDFFHFFFNDLDHFFFLAGKRRGFDHVNQELHGVVF